MLYTIGDLHLSFGTDKPMDIFGRDWENHYEKLKNSFSKLSDGDMCVICGDLTWGIDIKSCLEDFKFIDELPGQKVILKGNHDYWWQTAAKTQRFFDENGIKSIKVLNNNCFFYKETAICGTRGWVCQEGGNTHDKKMVNREKMRLEVSLAAAGDAKEKICFLHYPPVFGGARHQEMMDVMKEHGVKRCFYGHIHGRGRMQAFEGELDGITYRLISADHINFTPMCIMD